MLFVRMLRSLDSSVRKDQGCFLINTRSAAELFHKLCNDGRYLIGKLI